MCKLLRFSVILMFVLIFVFPGCFDDGGSSDGENTKENDIVVNINSIPGVVVPVRNEESVTAVINTDQYQGNISWSPDDNTFSPETEYTANITLTAKDGYTFDGVSENFFNVAGAVTVTNQANSGIVKAVFPETGEPADININFESVTQLNGVSGSAESTELLLSFSKDPETLTADEITVDGATKSAITGTGLTRNLEIYNITVADGAEVSVTITSPLGYAISGSSKSAIVYRLLTIGMDYLGGKIAYILQPGEPGYDTNLAHGIIVACSDQSSFAVWAKTNYNDEYVPDGTSNSIGAGKTNTDNIIDQHNEDLSGYAAGIARSYNGGGYDDWSLPSKDELEKLHDNKDYIGGFTADYYWSSSETTNIKAYLQRFDEEGIEDVYTNKSTGRRVRAVRYF